MLSEFAESDAITFPDLTGKKPVPVDISKNFNPQLISMNAVTN